MRVQGPNYMNYMNYIEIELLISHLVAFPNAGAFGCNGLQSSPDLGPASILHSLITIIGVSS